MPRTWRSQIADEVRSTSKRKARCLDPFCSKTEERKGSVYCAEHRAERLRIAEDTMEGDLDSWDGL